MGYLYNNGIIDAYFLKDIFSYCTIMSSERLIKCGKLVKRDVGNMVTFLDTVAKYLMENIKILKD